MRKYFTLFLALLMMLGSAQAEEAIDAVRLERGTQMQMDLDGDGAGEYVQWRAAVTDEIESVFLQVWERDGSHSDWMSDMLFGAEVYCADMDGDGKTEILVTGDEMSDDYITYGLHYTGNGFEPMLFENVGRGENDEEYYESGYGKVIALTGRTLTLCGSQDTFGTYMMERMMILIDGVFTADPGGFWFRTGEIDDEMWEYGALTVLQDIPCDIYGEDMPEPATLHAGEKILIVSTDKFSQASFYTEDGRIGFLTIAPDTERGWGYTVNGLHEEEVFGNIRYAD